MAAAETRTIRVLEALLAVAVSTAIMNLADVNHTVAALLYVVVVVGASFLGPPAAIAAVLASFACQNYFFTAPRGSLRITSADGIVELVVFAITAAVVSASVTRVNELRRRARVRELEARARLELSERLANGDQPKEVAAAGERTIVRLFGVRKCTIDLATGRVDVVAGARPLTAGEHDLVDAFARHLSTSVDRLRLDREADAARVAAAAQAGRAAFLSSMTHNLRTPLASIKASVSTLRDHDDLEPAVRDELLSTAQSETERLERLVTKVLHLSRIRSGSVLVEREPVDLAEIVDAALRSVRCLTTTTRVGVAEPSDGPVIADLDATLVVVALSCIVENALRYGASGGEILVTTSAGPARCAISVADHGPGIPIAERDRVFREFVRGEGVRDATGAGIGLAIARAFVAGHGGTITIQETPGGGATFVMELPYSGHDEEAE